MNGPLMALLLFCVSFHSLRAADQDEPSVQGKTLSEWVKLLKDPSVMERRQAVRAISMLGAKAAPAAPALVTLLGESDYTTKTTAETALIAIGAEAVPALAEALKDTKKGLRFPALMVLNRMPDKAKAAVPALVALLDEPEASTNTLVTSLLIRVGPEGISALHKVARDSNAMVRETALTALVNAPVSQELLDTATTAIKDESPIIRAAAVSLAARMGTQGVPLLNTALKDKDDNVRYRAVVQISAMGKLAKDTVSALRPLLKDKASHISSLTVTALGNFGSEAKEAVEDLLDVLIDPTHPMQSQAMYSLVKIGPASIPALEKAMKKADAPTRLIVVRYLGPFGKEALSLLLAGLKDETPAVRAAAAEGLGAGLLPKDERMPLTEAMKDPDPLVRSAAAGALARLGESESALPGLLEALEDEEQTIRDGATKAINLAGGAILKPLVKLLESQEENLRRRAALALHHVVSQAQTVQGPIPPEILPPLLAALKDDSRAVRRDVAATLGRLGNISQPQLVELLKSKNDLERLGAAEAFTHLISVMTPAASAQLSTALKDPHSMVRLFASAAIIRMGRPNEMATREFVEAFKVEEVTVRREAALLASTLGKAGRLFLQLNKPIGEIQVEALKDKDLGVRLYVADGFVSPYAAFGNAPSLPGGLASVFAEGLSRGSREQVLLSALALSRLGSRSSEAVEPLTAALKDRDSIVRRCALNAFGAIGELPAPAFARIMECLDDKVLEVRRLAVQTLATAGPKAKAAVPALVKLLTDSDLTIRLSAVETLGRIGPDAKPGVARMLVLLKSAASTPMIGFRQPFFMGMPNPLPSARVIQSGNEYALVMQALARIGPGAEEAIPTLLELLQTNSEKRRLAATVLSSIGNPAAEALMKGLKSEDASLRTLCIEALGGLNEPSEEVVKAIAQSIGDKDSTVRDQTLFALGRLGRHAKPALSALVKAMKNNTLEVESRGLAARTIGEIGPDAKEAVADLRAALKDDDAYVRLSAATALGNIGPEARDAITALTDLLKDESATVRRAATRALDLIQNKP